MDNMTAPQKWSQSILITPPPVAGYSLGQKSHLLYVSEWDMDPAHLKYIFPKYDFCRFR